MLLRMPPCATTDSDNVVPLAPITIVVVIMLLLQFVSDIAW